MVTGYKILLNKFACVLQPYLIVQGGMLLPDQTIVLSRSGQWKLHSVWPAAEDMK